MLTTYEPPWFYYTNHRLNIIIQMVIYPPKNVCGFIPHTFFGG